MKPIHYILMAGVAAMILAGGSSKSQDPKWPGDTVTDELRAQGVEFLKDAYKANGDSMTAWGAFEGVRIEPKPTPIPEPPLKKQDKLKSVRP